MPFSPNPISMSDDSVLNPQQREAITYLDGPCLVLAGAGSGKTRVITHKIAHLINRGFYPARYIAALTFTNKAAQEMQSRLRQLVPDKSQLRHLTVCTFHALGVQLLRAEAHEIGFKERFSIMDSADCAAVLQDLLVTTDRALIRQVQGRISLWKNQLLDPQTLVGKDDIDTEAQRVYPHYCSLMRAYQAVDLDDLLILPVQLFAANPQVRDKWQRRLRYLLIDEYQDTNPVQYELVKLLVSGPGKKPLFTAVGDDDQAIYAWRGATLANMQRIRDDFADLKLIALEQNYRSTNSILQAANQLIQHNPHLQEKNLWSELGPGEQIVVTAMADDITEAEEVLAQLTRHKFERRARFSDYAILYRSNYQAKIFERVLRRDNVPYKLSGGQSFFERAEIRDIMAYLRLLVNDDDDLAFIRAITTPRRGVGKTTIEILGNYARQWQCSLFAAAYKPGVIAVLSDKQIAPLQNFGDAINRIAYRAEREPVAEVLKALHNLMDYEHYLYEHCDEMVAKNRWQNLLEFCQWLEQKAEKDGKNLIELTQSAILMSILQDREEEADVVQLSTLHAAKGLEFRYVFLVGVEEGLLPHHGSPDDREEANPETAVEISLEASPEEQRLQEERRLMYVGITRARHNLFISWCKQRKRARQVENRERSRFIAEMGLEKITAPAPARLTPAEHLALIRAALASNSDQTATPIPPGNTAV